MGHVQGDSGLGGGLADGIHPRGSRVCYAEGDEAFGYDKMFVVSMLAICGLVALVLFGCFAVNAITHLAVPQVAMINDMLEMVQQ